MNTNLRVILAKYNQNIMIESDRISLSETQIIETINNLNNPVYVSQIHMDDRFNFYLQKVKESAKIYEITCTFDYRNVPQIGNNSESFTLIFNDENIFKNELKRLAKTSLEFTEYAGVNGGVTDYMCMNFNNHNEVYNTEEYSAFYVNFKVHNIQFYFN